MTDDKPYTVSTWHAKWFATAPQDNLRNDGAMLSVHQVAVQDPTSGCTIAEVYGDTESECRERGDLIVRAVNSHDKLLAVLCKAEAVLSAIREDAIPGIYDGVVEQLRAAIREASGDDVQK